MQRTDKISQLKQPIFRGAHILNEFNRATYIILKGYEYKTVSQSPDIGIFQTHQ